MRFDADDQSVILAAIGETATVQAGTLQVVFHGPAEQIDYQNGGFVNVPPYAMAAESDVLALGLVSGQNGTQITVDDRTWTVLSIEPDGDGFMVLQLGTAA